MYPVESSATLSREFSYKQVTVERVQLQRNYPVKSSSIQTSYPIEITCKQVTLKRVQLQISHFIVYTVFSYK